MLVISGGFLVEFLRFLKYTTASVDRDNSTYSPVCILIICLYYYSWKFEHCVEKEWR